MKKWNLVLETKDEEQALTYLKLLVNAFEVAVRFKEPMESFTIEGEEKHDKLLCTLKHD